MNYETAKKLKDAGFPQKGHGHALFPSEEIVNSTFVSDTILYVPTLSELIEACGEMVAGIHRGTSNKGEKYWAAGGGHITMKEKGFEYSLVEIGKTPEEAMANLWIELNKK